MYVIKYLKTYFIHTSQKSFWTPWGKIVEQGLDDFFAKSLHHQNAIFYSNTYFNMQHLNINIDYNSHAVFQCPLKEAFEL